MWKKLTIILVATFGFAISVLALDNRLFASDTVSYNAGGSVTGRVNLAPEGISGSNVGMQKGDKVLIGVKDENNVEIGWQLIKEYMSYTKYDLVLNADNSDYTLTTETPITAWFSMANQSLGNTPILAGAGLTNINVAPSAPFIRVGETKFYYVKYHDTEVYKNFMNSFQNIVINTINKNDKLKEVLKPINLEPTNTYAKNSIYTAASKIGGDSIMSNFNQFVFIPDLSYATSSTSPYHFGQDIPSKDLSFKENYHIINANISVGWGADCLMFDNTKGTIANTSCYINPSTVPKGDLIASNQAVRAASYLDMRKVVFGVSTGKDQGIAMVNEPNLSDSYTSIYEDTKNQKEMKLRVQDANYNAKFHKLINKYNVQISQAVINTSIYIDAEANSFDNSVVSAILFRENEISHEYEFAYYLPLELAAGKKNYTIDLNGIPIGKYKIAIVNEAYNESSTAPAASSLISDVKELEIVSPVSNLTFTPTSNLKYNSNVNVSDTVGTISSSNGAGTPVYTLIADSSHAGDVAKFEIGADGKTVKVKGSALDAGTYYFKVQAQDANGDPQTPLEISAQITVSKATTAVSFDTTTNTVKTMAQAQTSWNETATSTPSNSDLKITYDISGGDIGVITIDPDTGAIAPTSSNAKGKVTIRATVDDDPSTGKDNYDSASTTKSIFIIDGVDGTLTPDSASSDSITPTFKATDANVKTGGKIATITGVNGFFDNATSGTVTYSYELKTGDNSSYFLINSSTGVLTSNANLAVGTYQVTVIVSDKWSSKEIPITINVGQAAAETLRFYNPSDKTTVITTQFAKLGETGVSVFAEVKGSTNSNQVAYAIKSGSSTTVVSVHPTSGVITTLNAGTTIITATKKGISGQADATSELSFTVTAADQSFIYSDVGGNELTKNPDGSYQPYKENGKEKEYAKAGTFQLYTSGAPTGATVTYALKSGSPSDVISVDANGLVTILNANTNLQKDKEIVTATSIDPSGNYADKTIEIPINITKATPVISFKEVTNVANGTGSVEPVIQDQDLSSNAGGINVNDTQYIISVDPSFDSSIAWTNDGKTVKYSYSEVEGIEVPLKVTKPGNRNYNSAEATGKMNIVGQDESVLEVSTPGRIVYGDTFTIRSLQDDSSSTNVNYVFTLNDHTYVKDNTQTNNQMSFDAIKASGTNEIEIKVERTADGEMTLSKTIKVKVVPKDINIQLNSSTRKVGENNPVFTYQDFSSQLVSWNGVKDVIQPSDIKITSTANANSSVGSYPITLDSNHLNTTYPNYKFKAANTTLTVTQDTIGSDWYHMEKKDASSYTANTWVNQDVVVKSDHSDYTKLSLNKQVWEDELIVSTEGKTNLTFYMKTASNAVSGSKSELILIDKTKPNISSIKGKTSKVNPVEAFINAVTFNTFYKPGDGVEIIAEDVRPTATTEVSGIANIQYKLYEKESMQLLEDKSGASTGSLTFNISNPGTYKVCAIATDQAGNQSDETCEEIEVKKIDVDVDNDGKNDFNDPDGDGCPDINILWKNSDNTWTKINMDRNDDDIPDMNIDSNGDGIADLNVDTDNDGKPDLNLVVLSKADWKPTICVIDQPEKYCTGTSVKAQINVDTDSTRDDIPNINIDTDGDMKANINITKPNETKPWLNITSTHSKWEPKADYNVNGFAYDTDSTYKAILNVDSDNDGRPDLNIDFNGDGKPDINIDADGDGIPETDIDTDGDGNPDINIDINKDGKPDENIMDITKWEPKTDGEKDGLLFDTMKDLEGKNQLEDNDVVITNPGGIFLPNFALKVDRVTDTVGEVIKNDIIRKSNGQIIEEIFDVKLLKDNTQVQPDGKLQIKLPLPNNLKNPQLVVEQADGTYIKVKPEIKDGFLYYESDFLGKVSIVKDAEEETPTPDPKDPAIDPDEPTPDSGGTIKDESEAPSTSVKGTYYGGANTGDHTTMGENLTICFLAFGIIMLMKKHSKKAS